MRKSIFLLLLVPSVALAHGDALIFLVNHMLLYFALLIFLAFASPPGSKLVMTIGVMLIYPVLFFNLFSIGSVEAWGNAAYITITIIVILAIALRVLSVRRKKYGVSTQSKLAPDKFH